MNAVPEPPWPKRSSSSVRNCSAVLLVIAPVVGSMLAASSNSFSLFVVSVFQIHYCCMAHKHEQGYQCSQDKSKFRNDALALLLCPLCIFCHVLQMHPKGYYPVISLIKLSVGKLLSYPVLGLLLKVITEEYLPSFLIPSSSVRYGVAPFISFISVERNIPLYL